MASNASHILHAGHTNETGLTAEAAHRLEGRPLRDLFSHCSESWLELTVYHVLVISRYTCISWKLELWIPDSVVRP